MRLLQRRPAEDQRDKHMKLLNFPHCEKKKDSFASVYSPLSRKMGNKTAALYVVTKGCETLLFWAPGLNNLFSLEMYHLFFISVVFDNSPCEAAIVFVKGI